MSFSPAYIRNMYDNWAYRYDREFAANKWCGPQKAQDTLSGIFDMSARGIKILDVGVGTGMLSQAFRDVAPQAHITGIDLSAGMIHKCRVKKVADQLIRHDFHKDGLPFPDHSFDVVASTGVFELLEDPYSTIIEMGRVLKPGGAFAFTTYDHSFWPYSGERQPEDMIDAALGRASLSLLSRESFFAFTHRRLNDIHYYMHAGVKQPIMDYQP
jgi:ubiquinone/menaquinone biosynthesis C-methylase UbiE